MKSIARFIDRLLVHAVFWIGSPARGLPEYLDPEAGHRRPARGRWRFAMA